MVVGARWSAAGLPAARRRLPHSWRWPAPHRVHLLVADAAAHAAEGAGLFLPPRSSGWPARYAPLPSKTWRVARAAARRGRARGAGCRPVVFKGAALAHTHYGRLLAAAAARRRRAGGRARPRARLARAARSATSGRRSSGRLVMHQEMHVRADAGGRARRRSALAPRQSAGCCRGLPVARRASRARGARPRAGRRRFASPCSGRCARPGVCAPRGAPRRTRRTCCGSTTSTCWRAAWRRTSGALSSAPPQAGAVTALCARGLDAGGERVRHGRPAVA